jgi:uncharacterized membrane protein
MAFCGSCGAPLKEGNGFCGSCGKQASVSAPPAGPSSSTVNQPGPGNTAWTPINSPASPAATPLRQDSMAWSPAPAQPAPAPSWNSVPAQAPPAAPNTGQGYAAANPASAATAVPPASVSSGTGLTPNMAGALAYSLGIITGILFLVLEPYRRDRFVRFHAMQSILYFVFAVAFSIAWSIVVGILMHISGWIFVVAFPIRLIISLAMFGLWLYLMYQAYSQREFRIPVLGAIASKQAG